MPGGAQDDWLAGSGNWSNAANWSLGLPTASETAVIGGTLPLIVSFATTTAALATLQVSDPAATLDLTSGTLTLAGGSVTGALDQAGGTLVLAGGTLALAGAATLAGAISGPGSLTLGAGAIAQGLALDNDASLVVDGVLASAGALSVGAASGDTSALVIAADGHFVIAGPTTLEGEGTGGVVNAGLITALASGVSDIAGNFDNQGTLDLAHGTLGLFGGQSTLDGTITGAGALALSGAGDFILGAGLIVHVATLQALNAGTTLSLSGALEVPGAFTLGPGVSLALNGANLTLAGADSLAGVIAGPGTVGVTGATDLNGLILSGATLIDAATLTEDGAVSLASGAALAIAAGASFDFLTDAAFVARGTLGNAGLLEKSGGGGTSNLTADIVNTGTLSAQSGTLALAGGAASLGGTLTGEGSLLLSGAGTFTLEPGVVITVATLAVTGNGSRLTLAGATSDAHTFGLGQGSTLDLGGTTLSLSGPAALAGTLLGPGTLVLSGSADLAGLTATAGATLAVSGAALLDGPLTLGAASSDQAGLAIASGATLTIVQDGFLGGAGGALENAGILQKTGALGTTTLQGALGNTGTIAVSAGTLDIAGTLGNDGWVTVGDAALAIAGALGAAAGASGTLSLGAGARVTLGGAVAGNESLVFAPGDAALTLDEPGAVAAAISGFGAADTIDLAGLAANGFSYANNTLTLTEASNGGAASVVGALALPGLTDPAQLALAGDGAGGTEILLNPSSPVFSNPTAAITTATWSWDGASGTWTDAGWSSTPTASVLAVVPNDGAAASTLAYGTSATVNALAGGTLVTLDMLSGVLAVNDGADWAGAVNMSGGSLDLLSGGTLGSLALQGGTIALGAGVLQVGAATIGAAIGGGGTLALSGDATIVAGGAISTHVLDLDATTTLDQSLIYTGNLIAAAGGTLALNGHTLTLAGAADLAGTLAGAGAVIAAGSGDLSGAVIAQGASLRDQGTLIAVAAPTLEGATLAIAAGGVFDSLGNGGIAMSGAAALDNAGLWEKTTGNATGTLAGGITSSGTIAVADGTLLFTGADTFSGLFTGAGAVALAGTATLGAGLALDVAEFSLDNGASVALAGDLAISGAFQLGPGASLAAGAATLALAGPALLAGTLSGAGALDITGGAEASGWQVGGSETIALAGTLTADGSLTLGLASGDSPSLDIAAGGVFDLNADADLNTLGTLAIANAGVLEKTAGLGLSYLFANLDNKGTLAVARGTLSLASGSTTLGGALAGAGTLDLTAGPSPSAAGAVSFYTLEAGTALSLGAFGVTAGALLTDQAGASYGGAFTLAPGATLDPNNTTLSLTGGASLDGAIDGAGTVAVSGNVEAGGLAVSGGAVVANSGTLLLDGALTLGAASSAGQLVIAAGATAEITADAALTGYNGAPISNAGLFEKLAGLGASSFSGVLANVGTVLAARGTLDLTGTLQNDALAEAIGGTLVLANNLAATGGASGTLAIGAGGDAVLEGALAGSETIDFTAAQALLTLPDPGQVFGPIEGFAAGDTVDFTAAAFTAGGDTLTYANGTLAIADQGAPVAALAMPGNYTGANFALASDGAGGTALLFAPPPCFAAGTRLDTQAGSVAVEDLRPGERVLLAGGGFGEIGWIGSREIDGDRHPHPARVGPIRVQAGAFARRVPRRDVVLSPDHAIYAAGFLVPVKLLVNGASIREEPGGRVRYFHVELARHAVLLAEGLPVESYLDTGDRALFATPPPAIPATASARCAPLLLSGPALAALQGRLARRAARLFIPAQGASTRTPLSPAASTARSAASGRATQPAVGAKSGRATWRKIAEPRPGRGGSSFHPSTPIRS